MIGISSTEKWVKEQGDLSPCTGCKVGIVSAKYVLSIEVKMLNKVEVIPTSTVLCESCYEAIQTKKN